MARVGPCGAVSAERTSEGSRSSQEAFLPEVASFMASVLGTPNTTGVEAREVPCAGTRPAPSAVWRAGAIQSEESGIQASTVGVEGSFRVPARMSATLAADRGITLTLHS